MPFYAMMLIYFDDIYGFETGGFIGRLAVQEAEPGSLHLEI